MNQPSLRRREERRRAGVSESEKCLSCIVRSNIDRGNLNG